ncbi:acyl-CoA dehydrogenase family protein [Pseudomonas sp. BF-R-19]|uniref:acyl-CoA dehydrogenase family protein n=1 Tax=Pseudomonas sp. BF-R-19 TaxID=2832397 RepID=UPI001CBCC68F|nr:acyl-CoA dehydrogenase family protein [Pseudomonas sp. BF-R-19]
MNLHLDTQDQAFREEVRAFLRDNLPEDVRRRSRIGYHPANEEDRRWWQRMLFENNWAAAHWPTEYGGTGWTPIQQHIFEYESRMADAPELRWQGLRLLGPVLYTFGTDAQKARYLPAILRGDEQWAQGFSEPGAGSDLASLRATAVLKGDEYVLNGQKTWTTEGQWCEQGFFLVRTADTPKPQAGISMIIVDMKSPGITVRPIPMINGGSSPCEVFMDNVRVPKENIIGEVNRGWDQAKFLLSNERTSSSEIYKAYGDLTRIRQIASQQQKNGRPVIEDSAFLDKLTMAELEVQALEWAVLRVLCDAPSEHPVAANASVLKVRGSELQQRLSELAVEALGVQGLRLYTREESFADHTNDPIWPDYITGATNDLLYLRAYTIFGGAKEVQKNIIAKVAFGL